MVFASEAARHINLQAISYFTVGSAKEISCASELSPPTPHPLLLSLPMINFRNISGPFFPRSKFKTYTVYIIGTLLGGSIKATIYLLLSPEFGESGVSSVAIRSDLLLPVYPTVSGFLEGGGALKKCGLISSFPYICPCLNVKPL